MAPGSLTEFAAERGGRLSGQAACCRDIPPELLKEIESFVTSGNRAWTIIRDWLRENGVVNVSSDVVRYHFANGHHERRG